MRWIVRKPAASRFKGRGRFTYLRRTVRSEQAMSIFPKMKDMPPEEQAKARHDLLKYCELDTLAMVKVWQALCGATE